MLRWLLRGALALVVLLGVALAWLVSGVSRGPNVDGELAFPGLTDRVEVLRDVHGIPYIFANNTADLIRAQGFVTAQARVFQLEAYRALASGRLAEAIGERGLASDREMRTLGLRRNAARHAQRLAPAARDFLTWYAQGLNLYINMHSGDLPAELGIAGFKASPWTLEDMVTVLHFVNLSQAANYKSELVAQMLIDKVGPQRAMELLPINVNPDRARKIIDVASAPPTPLGLDALTLLAVADAAAAAPIAIGSNNWAIAPAKSASGAAVVINDPHLDARVLPGVWFPVGLFSPEVRAIGAALPAVPGIMVGRNARVAFGVTNAYGDSQDLFIERVAPGKPDHYLDGDELRPFETSIETIRVKDAKAPGGFREEKLAVRRTVRGPIIAGGESGQRLLSLRTATAEVEGREIGIDKLLTATSAADVDRAVQQMEVMYFNFVFGDKVGAIGHRASGRVPVRASGHGMYPKPATKDSDWRGFIAPDQMPGQMVPARGWVATANHDNRPDGYAYDYSSYFSPTYRYERIAQVLQAGKAMTTADQRALMTDTLNVQAQRLLPIFIAALKDDPAHADLAAILSAWNGRDQLDQPAPLIYHRLYEQLVFETYLDELGDELAKAYLKQWYGWQERFDRLVLTPDSPWFDDRRTPAVEKLPDLVRHAAQTVRSELVARGGSDPKAWRWGDVHRISFVSPLRRTGVGRDLLGAGTRAFDGSGETVKRARSAFMSGFDVEFFGSLRLVADLADDEKIMAVVSGGAVERQFHANQKDQLAPWFAGELLPWWFERRAIEANAKHRQWLVPAGK
ncbi:MAG TPA: penicillin acylase family protein [Burkholderiaceae bacterium]|nr:penicillin acylase family protein [Burkholderiaceae bacterium]